MKELTPYTSIEQSRNFHLIGRATHWLAEQTHPTIHHCEEASDAIEWLTQGDSLFIVYGPHTSIWDSPIPQQKLIRPYILPEGSNPDRHAIIASAKFDSYTSRMFNGHRKLHVPHMGIANAALKQYTDLMGMSVVFMVPETLRKRLLKEHPVEKDAIDAWAHEINTNAINQLVGILDHDGAIVEYFPEATRHENTFIRSETLLDVMFAKFRHKSRQLGVLPIALFGMEHLQPSLHQGTILGINPKVPIDMDILPLQTLTSLRDEKSHYFWEIPPEIIDPDFRVHMSDVVMKQLSLSTVVPSPSGRQGIYAGLVKEG